MAPYTISPDPAAHPQTTAIIPTPRPSSTACHRMDIFIPFIHIASFVQCYARKTCDMSPPPQTQKDRCFRSGLLIGLLITGPGRTGCCRQRWQAW